MPISKRKLKNGAMAYQATERTPLFPTVSKTFGNKKEAREWFAAIHGQRRRGLNYDPRQNSSMTLGEGIQKYAAVRTPKKNGARQELSLAKRWLSHPLAARPIGEILPFEFDEHVTARLAGGISASTVLKELSFLSQVYNFVRRKLRMFAVINPITDVDKPCAASPRTRRLTKDEEAKLLEFFEEYGNRYLAAAFVFAI